MWLQLIVLQKIIIQHSVVNHVSAMTKDWKHKCTECIMMMMMPCHAWCYTHQWYSTVPSNCPACKQTVNTYYDYISGLIIIGISQGWTEKQLHRYSCIIIVYMLLTQSLSLTQHYKHCSHRMWRLLTWSAARCYSVHTCFKHCHCTAW